MPETIEVKPVESLYDVLREARRILSPSEHWCQETLGVDSQENSLDGFSEEDRVCKVCLVGAISLICLRTASDFFTRYQSKEFVLCRVEAAILRLFPHRAQRVSPTRVAAQFNDHPDTTHEDILRVLDFVLENAYES